MAVVDGLNMGHRRCAMPMCANPSLDVHSKKLCVQHHEERGDLCGLVICLRPHMTDAINAGACDDPEHQRLWHEFRRSRHKRSFGAYRRVVRNHGAPHHGGQADAAEPWVQAGRWRVAQATTATDDPEQNIPHHQGSTSAPHLQLGQVQHLWQYRYMMCIETVTRPCGCVIAWAKFATSESPTNIINMLEELFPDGFPTYLVVDKACRILGRLRTLGKVDRWFETTRLLVDTVLIRPLVRRL